jgi:putative membrane protein
MKTIHWVLLAVWAAVLAWSGINPHDRFTWVLEVMPAWIALAICAWLFPERFRFTTLVYAIICVHCVVLMVGGKYTYAEMPLFNWLRDTYHLSRNYYDRVGHFMQGFSPAIIAREVLIRKEIIRGGNWWLHFIIVSIVLAFSAVYEFVEWWVALLTGESSTAFLGTQGDVWDTQWDMFMCTCGAILALLLLRGVHDRALRQLRPGLGRLQG